MIQLKSVHKPGPSRLLESLEAARKIEPTPGFSGTAGGESSHSVKYLVAKGKGNPLPRHRATNVLESIIGTDERVCILDTGLYPWRMICALQMGRASGAGAIGTGWLIGPKTVLTAGHCVFSNYFFGGWAAEIAVSPGRNGNDFPFDTVRSTRFSSVDAWVEREDADFDIGCIHLDDRVGDRVGWFSVAALPAEEIENYFVNISGYPGDRGEGTEQYFHKNRVLRVTERRLFYDVDTFGGQSGAPVWIQENEGAQPLAVGIHAYGTGGTPANFNIQANSAPRIIPEVLEQLKAWVEQDGGWSQ